MKEVPLSEVKDDLSRSLRQAERKPPDVARHRAAPDRLDCLRAASTAGLRGCSAGRIDEQGTRRRLYVMTEETGAADPGCEHRPQSVVRGIGSPGLIAGWAGLSQRGGALTVTEESRSSLRDKRE